jgi:hypothetical protein
MQAEQTLSPRVRAVVARCYDQDALAVKRSNTQAWKLGLPVHVSRTHGMG